MASRALQFMILKKETALPKFYIHSNSTKLMVGWKMYQHRNLDFDQILIK